MYFIICHYSSNILVRNPWLQVASPRRGAPGCAGAMPRSETSWPPPSFWPRSTSLRALLPGAIYGVLTDPNGPTADVFVWYSTIDSHGISILNSWNQLTMLDFQKATLLSICGYRHIQSPREVGHEKLRAGFTISEPAENLNTYIYIYIYIYTYILHIYIHIYIYIYTTHIYYIYIYYIYYIWYVSIPSKSRCRLFGFVFKSNGRRQWLHKFWWPATKNLERSYRWWNIKMIVLLLWPGFVLDFVPNRN